MDGLQRSIHRFLLWILLAGVVPANAETFDRSIEIDEYVSVMTNGTIGAATKGARRIYFSGISDARLAAVVSERLLLDYAELGPSKASGLPGFNTVKEEYGIWMVRALASSGIAEYKETLKKVIHSNLGGAAVRKMRKTAKEELLRVDWYATRNKVMASMDNYQVGEDPTNAMLVNLLLADDPECRDFALDVVNWEKKFDPHILQVLERQVREYAVATKGVRNPSVDDRIAVNIKLLGHSGVTQYRDVMNEVLASNAVTSVKRQAATALQRLQ
jgi:hypothetical protein